MKRRMAVFILTLALLLAGCGGRGQWEFAVGEKASTYWFDFMVESVEPAEEYGGRTAQPGSILLLCKMAIESTFDGSVPMGQGDFILIWEDPASSSSEPQAAYPLAKYADGQLPDEYDMEKGERWEGLLIYEVPEEVDQAAVLFEEQYLNGESDSGYDLGSGFAVSFYIP